MSSEMEKAVEELNALQSDDAGTAEQIVENVEQWFKAREVSEDELTEIGTIMCVDVLMELAFTPPGEGRQVQKLLPLCTMFFQIGFQMALKRYGSERPA